MSNKTFFAGPLTLIVLLLSLTATKGNPVDIDKAKLDARVQSLIRKYNVPDAEISIIRNDSVIYKFVKNPANEGKNYMIGSCSKSLAALTLMMLADKGEIDIDSPVKKYLPWFAVGVPDKADLITVRHLLNHTSGIGSQYGFFDYPTDDFSVFKTKLAEHLAKIHLLRDPGREFEYSNLNYLILGLVVESVTKGKYQEYLNNNVFPKIGMRTSYAGFSPDMLSRNIEPYQYILYNQPFKSRFYPHSDHALSYGYVSSNAADLSEYLKFMINQGIAPGHDTIISNRSYSTLITPAKGNYAMGWIKANYQNINMLGHSGLDETYSAVLAFCPDNKTGIVVLSNVNSLEFCSFVQTSVLDMIAGKPFFNPFSMEQLLRWIPGTIAMLALGLLLLNLYRWNKYSFKLGFVPKFLPHLRLVFGIILSYSGIFLIGSFYHVSIFSVIDFQPDIVLSVLFILIAGLLSSFARYFGTYSKIRK